MTLLTTITGGGIGKVSYDFVGYSKHDNLGMNEESDQRHVLGLKRGTVLLLPHNEAWHKFFAEEKKRILDAIGKHVTAIEHVGSTAICGIVAKPILDMMVGIATFKDGEKRVQALKQLGYEYKGENGVPFRHFFGQGIPRTHHLHMVAVDGDFWKNHLLFRDHLRHNNSAAQEYNDLKLSLANRFPNDREAYTSGKETFVERILAEASRSEIQ